MTHIAMFPVVMFPVVMFLVAMFPVVMFPVVMFLVAERPYDGSRGFQPTVHGSGAILRRGATLDAGEAPSQPAVPGVAPRRGCWWAS